MNTPERNEILARLVQTQDTVKLVSGDEKQYIFVRIELKRDF